jgi:hypothetical protein
MFRTYPTYHPYRTLQLLNPMLEAEDVYALQIALNECGFGCGVTDGIFGIQTMWAVKAAQKAHFLTVDGKAGGLTQRALALDLAIDASKRTGVLYSGLRGQLELESGYRLGNYSLLWADRTYDAGIAQRNTQVTSPAQGFDPRLSIDALAEVIRKHYFLFEGLTLRRRWSLAQGAWNAPAFACYIAREEGATKVTEAMTLKPTVEQQQIFLTYVTNVTAYLRV